MVDLSIIIVSWNTSELLAHCLTSIYANPPLCSFEVIVVDNASTDDTAERVREHFPAVRIISNTANVGFARANNQGIVGSRGQYVLLLNPDTVIIDDALEQLGRFMERTPDAGIVGPRLLNPDGTLQESCYPEPTVAGELWRLFHLDSLYAFGRCHMGDWDTVTPRSVDVLLGACLLLRREVFNQIGLLDDEYFMYSEEVDLCQRARTHGWSLYWVPAAELIHYGGQSTQQIAATMFLQLYESKVLYFRKHHSRLTVYLYKFILVLASLSRLALSSFALFEDEPRRRRHLTLAGYYRRLLYNLPSF